MYIPLLCIYAQYGVITCVIYPNYKNLVRQLKLVEHESQQMAFEDQRLPLSQFREEMKRYTVTCYQYNYVCVWDTAKFFCMYIVRITTNSDLHMCAYAL